MKYGYMLLCVMLVLSMASFSYADDWDYEIILKNARNIKELEYKNLSDQKFDDLDTAWRAVKADHPDATIENPAPQA